MSLDLGNLPPPEDGDRPNLLGACVATFQDWLHLPDPGGLFVALATVVANRASGDPLWLFLVAPPSSGKTEILNALSGLPDCHGCSQMTEAGLLSGSAQRKSAGATGGLLRVIGDFGIVVLKDFGSVLSMPADKRGQLLAGLREIYDGYWRRDLGSLGGVTLDWGGKIGMVAGVTEAIDTHYSVIGSMGDRWLLYRLPSVDGVAQARKALAKVGQEGAMRDTLRNAATEVVERAATLPRIDATDAVEAQLTSLAILATQARAAVERDGYQRDIVNVHRPEGPARFVKALIGLRDGLTRLGVDDATTWGLLGKAAVDSMPRLRWRVLALLGRASASTVEEIADAVRYPNTTTRRTLEDLAVLDLVVRNRGTSNMPDRWALPGEVRSWMGCLPENVPVGDLAFPGISLSSAALKPLSNSPERVLREEHRKGDTPQADSPSTEDGWSW